MKLVPFCLRSFLTTFHSFPIHNSTISQFFLLFIFYTSLSCGYSFVFVVYRFFNCIGQAHPRYHGPRCVDHPTDLLPLVGLAVEALLFGLFTLCMMVDQWDVVTTNLTHIDRLKAESRLHPPHGRGPPPRRRRDHDGCQTDAVQGDGARVP